MPNGPVARVYSHFHGGFPPRFASRISDPLKRYILGFHGRYHRYIHSIPGQTDEDSQQKQGN